MAKYPWINVRDEMPTKEGYYRIKNGKNTLRFVNAYYIDGKFYSKFERYHSNAKSVAATHWAKVENI